jgi:RimJ/RimL family protein N-acetyltransferase
MTATLQRPLNVQSALRDRVVRQIADWKSNPEANELSIGVAGETYSLRPLGAWCLQQPEIIRLIADSRRRHQIGFPVIFNVTYSGTLAWTKKRVIEDAERILYGVFNTDGCMVAHAGLATFDWSVADVEIDNVMRCDETAPKGLMTEITKSLVQHAYQNLGLSSVSLRVFGDNHRAIKLYMQCGFQPIESIPLTCVFNETGLSWQPQDSFESGKTFRIFLRMKHDKR